MNIFFLDYSPKKCAEFHNSVHINKMIIESAQLLSFTAHKHSIPAPYKNSKSHSNHPCRLWLDESRENLQYLIDLTFYLNSEYKYRRSNPNVNHKSYEVIFSESAGIDFIELKSKLPNIPMTMPALAMPEQYKSNNPIKSYRDYYCGEKHYFIKGNNRIYYNWGIRGKPEWFI